MTSSCRGNHTAVYEAPPSVSQLSARTSLRAPRPPRDPAPEQRTVQPVLSTCSYCRPTRIFFLSFLHSKPSQGSPPLTPVVLFPFENLKAADPSPETHLSGLSAHCGPETPRSYARTTEPPGDLSCGDFRAQKVTEGSPGLGPEVTTLLLMPFQTLAIRTPSFPATLYHPAWKLACTPSHRVHTPFLLLC